MTTGEEPNDTVPPLEDAEAVRLPADGSPRLPALELLGWLAVVLTAAGLRLVGLGGQPLSVIEGRSAFQAWSFAQGRVPAGWSGSLLNATQALLIKGFGSADQIVRLSPALAGTALVAALWLLRPWLGRRATLAAALLAAISPVLVADARSASGQAWGAFAALMLLLFVLRFLREPSARALIPLLFTLLIGLSTDAVYVGLTLSIAGWLVLRYVWLQDTEIRCAWAALRRHPDWLLNATPMALAALLLVLSRYGTVPDRLRPAALDSFARAFAPVRPGVPWHYLLDVLAGYELPLAGLAILGCWAIVRRSGPHRARFSWLVALAAGGLVLALLAASRDPSTLVLAALPLTLLGGFTLAAYSRLVPAAEPNVPDSLIAAALGASLFYLTVVSIFVIGHPDQSILLPWFGAGVAAVCALCTVARLVYEGHRSVPLGILVMLGFGLLFELHGSGSVAFLTRDEYLVGQRTSREAVATACLLETNNGGVSSVTDALLPPLAWYLRDTERSGGHGQARVIGADEQVPAGFHPAAAPAVTSRSWNAATFNPGGFVRWWLSRTAWGPVTEARGLLVVEDQ